MMFDVHCLIHPEANLKYFPALLRSLEFEKDVNLHISYGSENVGHSRTKAFQKGKCEWVSLVDCDDLVVPGIFAKIKDCIHDFSQLYYTDEVLINGEGTYIRHGWSCNPGDFPTDILKQVELPDGGHFHHLLVIHRDLLTKDVLDMMSEIYWNPEPPMVKYIVSKGATWERIPHVGYCWRIHGQNGSLTRNTGDVQFDLRR